MNWFKIAQSNELIFWHATTPRLAEEIIDAGMIRSSLDLEKETGQQYGGWNFHQVNNTYGSGIYLAKEQSEATYYAMIRLKQEWENNRDNLDDEDQYGFIGLFKIHILNQSKLTQVDKNEVMYMGNILAQQNQEAWFDIPTWVDKTKELEEYRNHIEKTNQELYGDNSSELV